MFQSIILVFGIRNQQLLLSLSWSENITLSKFPRPPKDPCTDSDKMCDFTADCQNNEDEAKCGASAHLLPFLSFQAEPLHLSAGDFSYAEGSSGWTDTSIGGQGWDLYKNATSKGTNTFWRCCFVSLPHNTVKNAYLLFAACHRGIPACSGRSRPAADWGPDPDPSPGPHWPSLHPQLWFCLNWAFEPHRWAV